MGLWLDPRGPRRLLPTSSLAASPPGAFCKEPSGSIRERDGYRRFATATEIVYDIRSKANAGHGVGVMKEGAVVYIRVSTQEQAQEGVSLEAQEERIRAYLTLRGLDCAAVIREEGISAGKPLATRPGGQELLALVAAGKVAHVVALKLDRLFRDAEDALHETKAWDKAGVALHLVDMGGTAVDTRSPMGRMILTMLAGFAEFERGIIRERTATALRHKKAHRQAYSPTPFGFDRHGDTLIASPTEQATLEAIRGWHRDGQSLRAIARELTAQGIPTKRGGRWEAATVSYLLKNSIQLEGVA